MNNKEEIKLALPEADDTDTPRFFGYVGTDRALYVRDYSENTSIDLLIKDSKSKYNKVLTRQFIKGPFKAADKVHAISTYLELLKLDTDFLLELEQIACRKILAAAGKMTAEEVKDFNFYY